MRCDCVERQRRRPAARRTSARAYASSKRSRESVPRSTASTIAWTAADARPGVTENEQIRAGDDRVHAGRDAGAADGAHLEAIGKERPAKPSSPRSRSTACSARVSPGALIERAYDDVRAHHCRRRRRERGERNEIARAQRCLAGSTTATFRANRPPSIRARESVCSVATMPPLPARPSAAAQRATRWGSTPSDRVPIAALSGSTARSKTGAKSRVKPARRRSNAACRPRARQRHVARSAERHHRWHRLDAVAQPRDASALLIDREDRRGRRSTARMRSERRTSATSVAREDERQPQRGSPPGTRAPRLETGDDRVAASEGDERAHAMRPVPAPADRSVADTPGGIERRRPPGRASRA